MSLYIWLALAAYLCFALSSLGDKFILNKAVPNPMVFAFYVGIFSGLAIFLAPFGLHMLTFGRFMVALAGSVAFIWALVFYYRAIHQSSASQAVTMIGGLEPIFVLGLAFVIASERLNIIQLAAFVLMLLGSVFISLEKSAGKWITKNLLDAIIAAFLFSLSLALYKSVYNHTNFISGFVWTRLGLALAALSFLLYRPWRQQIFGDAKQAKPRSGKFAFIGTFVAGATGTVLQNVAISRGSVSIVTAMSGAQFAFVLILAFLITKYFPQTLKEDIRPAILIQKIIAILLIACGLIILNI